MSRNVLVTAAVSGVLSMVGGPAHADAVGNSAVTNSPGVVSGNSAQVPVHVPVNVCGNTVNVIGLLNPAFGNTCANRSGMKAGKGAGATAASKVSNSPGVGSGNNAQVPVHVPVNLCGNTVDGIAGLNPAFGNDCANESGGAAAGTTGTTGASAESVVSHSPGVVSGNNAQVPVHVPVNLCGNTVDGIAGLNPAFGNDCENGSAKAPAGNTGTTGASAASVVSHSPGVISGNGVEVPVHVPVNVCGNTADLIGALNPAFGNDCANGPAAQTPPVTQPPADQPPVIEPPADQPPADEPPADEPPADEPPADEPPADEPPADEPPADEPPADEPPADEPPADEPPADEPPVTQPPVTQPPANQPPTKPTPPSKPKPGKPTTTPAKPKPSKPTAPAPHKPGKPTGKPIG
ncbi:chaplin family protein [Streptomyces sp. NPDC004111]|uniref:chaplin n=1 Tax=Streptomyces sp. NPDC004111 TaxID=3364690 RepID=UPI0036CEB8AD